VGGSRIVSGGQTGVDRAALDIARELGMPYGGFVPKGRWTEDGPLSVDYQNMIETESPRPASRTRRNIRNSDATLVLTRGEADEGTRLTLRTAERLGKPLLQVDLARTSVGEACAEIRAWLAAAKPATLNVAGPRESKAPGIHAQARVLLREVFAAAAQPVRRARPSRSSQARSRP
jgi:hypothetical protein